MAVLQLLSDLLRNLSSNARDCHNTVITLISLVLHSSEVLKMAVKYRSGDHNFNTKLKAICNEITRWVKKEFKSPFEIQSEHVWGVPRLQEMRVGRNICGLLYVTVHVKTKHKSAKIFFELRSYAGADPGGAEGAQAPP